MFPKIEKGAKKEPFSNNLSLFQKTYRIECVVEKVRRYIWERLISIPQLSETDSFYI